MLKGDLCDVTKSLCNVKGRLVLCYKETCVMLQGDLCNVTGRLI